MTTYTNPTIVDLAKRETLVLSDIPGTTLLVTRGAVWITEEDDSRDIVLGPGEAWTVEREGLTIVEAQTDTTLTTRPPVTRPTFWEKFFEKLAVRFALSGRPVPYL